MGATRHHQGSNIRRNIEASEGFSRGEQKPIVDRCHRILSAEVDEAKSVKAVEAVKAVKAVKA